VLARRLSVDVSSTNPCEFFGSAMKESTSEGAQIGSATQVTSAANTLARRAL
jgi:hypothetical protein